ncbi:hypothetical protein LCGC14_1359840 [marine sediment metagenome]|uniref:Uncharacterized protein n=1 Tax=marine sediment metagenome TaxID=412755 RepID=A0A0F9KUI1_9ZZZZ
MKESTITINGQTLSSAEAMTIRVAVESLSMSLVEEGLGEDEMGLSLTKGYLNSIQHIRTKMYK